MSTRTRRRQDGQILVLTALVMVFVLGALLVAVADLLVLSSEQTQADTAAQLGAVSGSQVIDTAQFSSGVTSSSAVRLGPGAVTSCKAAVAAADPGSDVTCTVSGSTITVHVTKHVELPVPVLGFGSTVGSTRQAGAALGTVHPY